MLKERREVLCAIPHTASGIFGTATRWAGRLLNLRHDSTTRGLPPSNRVA